MSKAIVPTSSSSISIPEVEVDAARDFASKAKSENTKDAYRADWASWSAWASARQVQLLPADPRAVAVYLAHLATSGRKTSTIERALAGIIFVHKRAGHVLSRKHPAISETLSGIRRELGVAQKKKTPFSGEDVRRVVGALTLNERAILLLGWFCAMRRGEIVALNIGDIEFAGSDGMRVTSRRSKTDQEGAGFVRGVPFADAEDADLCPVRTLREYIGSIGEKSPTDPLFTNCFGNRMSDAWIARFMKRVAAKSGLDPAQFAGHSIRSGFISTAAAQHVGIDAIMRQTGHSPRSVPIVLGYIRHATVFDDNAAKGILRRKR